MALAADQIALDRDAGSFFHHSINLSDSAAVAQPIPPRDVAIVCAPDVSANLAQHKATAMLDKAQRHGAKPLLFA
jgi:hypothetical protein